MRIKSIDENAWLEISRNGDEFHSPFLIECSVNLRHGKFSAKNGEVHFLNLEEFVKNLDAFILNRKLTAQLNGTYDVAVKFFQPQDKQIAMVGFVIGDAFTGRSLTTRFKTEGEFEINTELLNDLVRNFKKFLERR